MSSKIMKILTLMLDLSSFLEPLEILHDCTICPRNCHTDRFKGKTGYCRSDNSFNIASICLHKGEEPVISGSKGICNIFFTNCNLQCLYCQNHQISNTSISRTFSSMSLDEVIEKIIKILNTGIDMVGFVSPSHFIPQMLAIINATHAHGYHPRWVYNSNGYDKVSTLKTLEGIIDIYLPDMKYMDSQLALKWSDAEDYPEIAAKALKEMFRQKGSRLILNGDHTAASGMIVRHLVLPGQTENSKEVIRFLSSALSSQLHISLMSQYFPIQRVMGNDLLSRTITDKEYQQVIDEMEKQGMENGWVQDVDSSLHYIPDFERKHPFETI